jgi:hypothetical protein
MKIQGSISHPTMKPERLPEATSTNGNPPHILSEHLFNKILRMEEKRAIRSKRPLILLVLDAESVDKLEERRDALTDLAAILPGTLRLTDVTGWYEENSSLGILLTEIGSTKPGAARLKVISKIADALERAHDFQWGGSINVTAEIIGNGSGSSTETKALGQILNSSTGKKAQRVKPRSRGSKPAYLKELLLVGCDAFFVVLCSLVILWSPPLSEHLAGVSLIFDTCLSLLILLSVSLLFGFYKIERLWLARNKLRQIGVATATVIGVSLLWSLFAPEFLFRPELFLGQTLIVWFLSLSWKFLYLRYYLKSEVDRVFSIQHRNAI